MYVWLICLWTGCIRRHRLVVHYFLCDDTVEVLEKLGRNSGADNDEPFALSFAYIFGSAQMHGSNELITRVVIW